MSDVDHRLRQVEALVDQLRSGAVGPPEFAGTVRGLLQALAAQEAQIRDVALPAEALEGLREELTAGFRGIERFREGLELLLASGAVPCEDELQEGLAAVREGNALLNRAVELNRQARADLAQLHDDLSKRG